MDKKKICAAIGQKNYDALLSAGRHDFGDGIVGMLEALIKETREMLEGAAETDAPESEIRFRLGEISGFKRALRLFGEITKTD